MVVNMCPNLTALLDLAYRRPAGTPPPDQRVQRSRSLVNRLNKGGLPLGRRKEEGIPWEAKRSENIYTHIHIYITRWNVVSDCAPHCTQPNALRHFVIQIGRFLGNEARSGLPRFHGVIRLERMRVYRCGRRGGGMGWQETS